MEPLSKLQVGITSAALAVGLTISCVYYLKHKRRYRDAIEVFNRLNIKTVTSEKFCDEVVKELRKQCQKHKALGFDCEWVTEKGHRHPVALVQISSYDGQCGLFRLNSMKHIPDSLKSLLEDETIYKVGVAPSDDGRYLFNDYAVDLKGTLDLRHLAELCGYNPSGLASLSKDILGAIMDKSWRVRCSDWEAPELTERQTNYAAIDAHAAVKIFVKLIEELYCKHSWLSSWSASNDMDVWSKVDEYCWKYVDIKYKARPITEPSNEKKSAKQNLKQLRKKEPLLSKRYPNALRSKPLYHNCFLQAPDGELLCTCDDKKALWYIEKGLADLVTEDPMTVRLKFEPAGRSVGDVGKYYQMTKENKCVVCGNSNSYIRKNVVPREYRKYFPEIMKEHSSHDVVLLCISCHMTSNRLDQAVREQLGKRCSAPLPGQGGSKFTENETAKKVRSAARALLYSTRHHEVPEARLKELENVVLQHFPEHTEITEELLQMAIDVPVLIENSDYEVHGVKVVEHFLKTEGLLRLEEIWREHFLTAMKPKYMPTLWSIKHNEERLRIKWEEGRLSQEDLKSMGLTRF